MCSYINVFNNNVSTLLKNKVTSMQIFKLDQQGKAADRTPQG
jgi:hypothetical protein